MSRSKGHCSAAHQPAAETYCYSLGLQVKAIAAHLFKCWFDPLCVSQPARAVSILFETAGGPGQSTGKQALLPKRIYVPANSLSHTILCISSPLHIYISWLDHKCFFCKDVVVWSEFSSLVEKMLKMLILMFSSLHVSLMTIICQYQFKRQPSPGEDSHLWKTRDLCPFLSFSTCLCSSSDHAIPPLSRLSLISIITSAWQVTGLHGQLGTDWDLWERKEQVSFGQSGSCSLIAFPEAIHSPNVDRLAKYRAAKHINLSTGIVLLPFRVPMLEVQHSTLLDKELN